MLHKHSPTLVIGIVNSARLNSATVKNTKLNSKILNQGNIKTSNI